MRRWSTFVTFKKGISWLLAGLFLYSGIRKLMEPDRFAVVIAGFGLLPDSLIQPATITLPILEVVTGLGVFLSIRGSCGAMAGLLLLFIAVLLYGIHLGLDIDCGCFGPEDPEQAYKGLKAALIRDLVMLAALSCICWKHGRPKG
jgi:uncharacterized membrane protein YphA (DoxX/SURF4 family)